MSLTDLMGLYLESTGSDITFNYIDKIMHALKSTVECYNYSLVLVLLELDCLTFQTAVLLFFLYQYHLLLFLQPFHLVFWPQLSPVLLSSSHCQPKYNEWRAKNTQSNYHDNHYYHNIIWADSNSTTGVQTLKLYA